ncbi:hypothetical protein Tsubulata_036532 [Turnera subulata]|uniref:Cullin family profile domain-containing protein n=1 Tax=Turnera subulata TaxID=218843 RepID=A0A9Q0FU50_9ROSI|nr:hypothetical protein Tsubulata_036532 [Turnera subulata]
MAETEEKVTNRALTILKALNGRILSCDERRKSLLLDILYTKKTGEQVVTDFNKLTLLKKRLRPAQNELIRSIAYVHVVGSERIAWESGRTLLDKAISKVGRMIDGSGETFNAEEITEIYSTCFNLSNQPPPNNYARVLYDTCVDAIHVNLTSKVLPSIRENEFILTSLVEGWSKQKMMLKCILSFCGSLDRVVGRPDVVTVGLQGCKMVFDKCHVKAKKAVFEGSEQSLEKETRRVAEYLHPSSVPELMRVVNHQLLVVNAKQLLEKKSGCRALLRDDKVDDLSRMYRLYSKNIEVLKRVAAFFKEHITASGTDLIQQAEDNASQALVTNFLRLHDKYMAYVQGCFQNHILFHKALRQAFEILCNKTVAGRSTAELLATVCDNTLKKDDSKKLSDEAIEDKLEKMVILLSYMNDKDVFSEFYRQKLAHRLLFEKSAIEHEKTMLTNLRMQCGPNFTSKMDAMIADIESTRKFQEDFKQDDLGFDLSVEVLTSEKWPNFRSPDLKLPAEMERGLQAFKEYSTKKKRKLTWVHSLGRCLIEGNFLPNPVELDVTPYQAAILMLFNDADRLSYSEIATKTGIAQDDLNRVLHSLSCNNKYKILQKIPMSNTVSQTDTFEVNDKFTADKMTITVPVPHPRAAVEQRKKVVEDVVRERRYLIDAAIVYIMKRRQILSHEDLISQSVEALKSQYNFKAEKKTIKQRIEYLIDEGYIERDKGMYRYSTSRKD